MFLTKAWAWTQIRKRIEEVCHGEETCIEEGIQWEIDHPNGISLEEQRSMDQYASEASYLERGEEPPAAAVDPRPCVCGHSRANHMTVAISHISNGPVMRCICTKCSCNDYREEENALSRDATR